MIVLFIDKLDEENYVVMYTGPDVDSFFVVLKSSKNIYELYALYIEDILDTNRINDLYICHSQMKKLLSSSGASYEIASTQHLKPETLGKIRGMTEKINILYDKNLNSKFRFFLEENDELVRNKIKSI
jgi:hypothetical protein